MGDWNISSLGYDDETAMAGDRQNIGRYDVLGMLGSGGSAQVLLGRLRDPSGFERMVALKVLLPEFADLDGSLDMLLDEARLAASIHHPNVAQVHELLVDERCIVMEYLAGESVAKLIAALRKRGQALTPALACHVAAEACAGLHAAHELRDGQGTPTGLVHRDISPQNLLITYDGAVKVLDFGVARATGRRTQTQVGLIKGKTAYMSPEQSLGRPLDRRSDVFAMGIVLWEMLTGRSLFRRTGGAPVATLLTLEPLTPPGRLVKGLPDALDAVCLKALAADPVARFADAAELRREVLKCMRGLPLDRPGDEALAAAMAELFGAERARKEALMREAAAPAPLPPTEPPAPRKRVSLTWVAAAAAVLTAVFGAAWALRRAAEPPPPAAGPAVVAAAPVALPPRVESAPAAAPEPPAPQKPPPAVAAKVKVRVETVPPGADVRIGDRPMGRTPVELVLGRASVPVKLSVARAGNEPVEQVLVPDRDQRVLLQLARRRAGRGPADPLEQKW